MKIKRILALFITITLFVTLSSVVFPAEVSADAKDKIEITVGSPFMHVNGFQKTIDPDGKTAAVLLQGNILAPVKTIVEEMGGSYSWDSKTKKIEIKSGKKTVQLWIDKNYSMVNGKKVNLTVAPKVIKGKIMAPVKFIIEQMGGKMQWNKSTNQIIISFDKPNFYLSDQWSYLVINDYDISRKNVVIKEEADETYIFIDSETFKYSFKYPYLDNNYPEVTKENGTITATWSDKGEILLEVGMEIDSPVFTVNGQQVDAGMGPYTEGERCKIPINLFVAALNMDIQYDDTVKSILVQYKDSFPADLIVGTWSTINTDIFTTFTDPASGLKGLSSFTTGYRFNKDGTYALLMVAVGGFEDTWLQQKGKYKIYGNTIMFYDISETLYKGSPFKLKYINKLTGKPEYSFIDDFDAENGKIDIDGTWVSEIKEEK